MNNDNKPENCRAPNITMDNDQFQYNIYSIVINKPSKKLDPIIFP